MPGDDFRKLLAGQTIKSRFPARAYNWMLDAAAALKLSQFTNLAGTGDLPPQTGIVLVQNNSGANRNRFDVLGVNGPIILPSANLTEFQRQVTIAGILPDGTSSDRFVVLQEPLEVGAVGRGVIDGVTVARVLVDEAAQLNCCADAIPGYASALGLVPFSGTQVLWREAGSSGMVNAILRVGPSCAPFCTEGEGIGYGSGVFSGGTPGSGSGGTSICPCATIPSVETVVISGATGNGANWNGTWACAEVSACVYLAQVGSGFPSTVYQVWVTLQPNLGQGFIQLAYLPPGAAEPTIVAEYSFFIGGYNLGAWNCCLAATATLIVGGTGTFPATCTRTPTCPSGGGVGGGSCPSSGTPATVSATIVGGAFAGTYTLAWNSGLGEYLYAGVIGGSALSIAWTPAITAAACTAKVMYGATTYGPQTPDSGAASCSPLACTYTMGSGAFTLTIAS